MLHGTDNYPYLTPDYTPDNDQNRQHQRLTIIRYFSYNSLYDFRRLSADYYQIHTLVLDAISVDSYHKALIVKLCFRQIIPLSNIPYIYFSDFMLTVASHFEWNTEFVDVVAEATTISIPNDVSLISNLKGIGSSDVSSKPITVLDPTHYSTDLTYFTFRTVVSAIVVDVPVLVSSLFLNF